jgi:hypothetical protein
MQTKLECRPMLTKLNRLRYYSLTELKEMFQLFVRLLKAECYLRAASSGSVVQNLQVRRTSGAAKAPDAKFLNRLIRLIEIADRQHPFKPSCIRKALVLKEILETEGLEFQIRVGVQPDAQGLQAHVWMEACGLRLESQPSAVDFKVLEAASRPPS